MPGWAGNTIIITIAWSKDRGGSKDNQAGHDVSKKVFTIFRGILLSFPSVSRVFLYVICILQLMPSGQVIPSLHAFFKVWFAVESHTHLEK